MKPASVGVMEMTFINPYEFISEVVKLVELSFYVSNASMTIISNLCRTQERGLHHEGQVRRFELGRF